MLVIVDIDRWGVLCADGATKTSCEDDLSFKTRAWDSPEADDDETSRN